MATPPQTPNVTPVRLEPTPTPTPAPPAMQRADNQADRVQAAVQNGPLPTPTPSNVSPVPVQNIPLFVESGPRQEKQGEVQRVALNVLPGRNQDVATPRSEALVGNYYSPQIDLRVQALQVTEDGTIITGLREGTTKIFSSEQNVTQVSPARLTSQQIKHYKNVLQDQLESSTVSRIVYVLNKPKFFVPSGEEAFVIAVLASVGALSFEPVVTAFGASVGYFGTFSDKIELALKSAEFRDWNASREKMLRSSSLVEFITSDEVLKHFKCPLSKKIPNIPVCFPSDSQNMTYDYATLIIWMSENEGKIPPDSSVSLNLDMEQLIEHIEIDFAYIMTFMERFEEIIEKLTNDDPLVKTFTTIHSYLNARAVTLVVLDYLSDKNDPRKFMLGTDRGTRLNEIFYKCLDLRKQMIKSQQKHIKDAVDAIFAIAEKEAKAKKQSIENIVFDAGREVGKLESRMATRKKPIINDGYKLSDMFLVVGGVALCFTNPVAGGTCVVVGLLPDKTLNGFTLYQQKQVKKCLNPDLRITHQLIFETRLEKTKKEVEEEAKATEEEKAAKAKKNKEDKEKEEKAKEKERMAGFWKHALDKA